MKSHIYIQLLTSTKVDPTIYLRVENKHLHTDTHLHKHTSEMKKVNKL